MTTPASSLDPKDGVWDIDAWLDRVTGPDWQPYDSGLLAESLAGDE